jgi:hypothetical protein
MSRKATFKKPESYVTCPRCHGTGCPAGGAVDAMKNRRFGQSPPLCGQCAGKGKIPGVPVEQKQP